MQSARSPTVAKLVHRSTFVDRMCPSACDSHRQSGEQDAEKAAKATARAAAKAKAKAAPKPAESEVRAAEKSSLRLHGHADRVAWQLAAWIRPL